MWQLGGPMKIARARRTQSRLSWRARRALRSAKVLDDVVDSQLELIPHLPAGARRESADYLAELVLLGQAYRHYAIGWISRRDLDRRGRETLKRLEAFKRPSAQQLTERE